MASKKKAAKQATAAAKVRIGPPIIRLPLVGKIKRADIRKAIMAVRKKNAKASAVDEER